MALSLRRRTGKLRDCSLLEFVTPLRDKILGSSDTWTMAQVHVSVQKDDPGNAVYIFSEWRLDRVRMSTCAHRKLLW